MNKKNKYRLLESLLFPFIIGVYCGRCLINIGEVGFKIEKLSFKMIDKYGEIIVKKLDLKK